MTMESSEARMASAVAAVMRALGDRTRLTLVMELSRGEQNVSELCAKLKIPQPTVSHHLALLRHVDLVTPRRSGKNVHYSLGAAARALTDGAVGVSRQGVHVRVIPDLSEDKSPGAE